MNYEARRTITIASFIGLAITLIVFLIPPVFSFIEGSILLTILLFLVVIGTAVGLIVVGNFFLDWLSLRFGYIYWPLLVGFAIALFVASFFWDFFGIDETGREVPIIPNVMKMLYTHAIFAYFALPLVEGHTTTYFYVEEEYIGYSKVSAREYSESHYVPGWWKKLIAALVYGGICFAICCFRVPFPMPLIPFILEVLYCGYISFVMIKRKISYSRYN